MERYLIDEYIDPEYYEDNVNVNSVCSARYLNYNQGEPVQIDFHNGWVFDSGNKKIDTTIMNKLVSELQRVGHSPGKAGFTGNFRHLGWPGAIPPLENDASLRNRR